MVVLGYPLHGVDTNYKEILESVASNVSCPVVVVRFLGQLHTERILIPVVSLDGIKEVYPIVAALDCIGEHQVQLLYLLHSGEADTVLKAKEEEIYRWLGKQEQQVNLSVKLSVTDARVKAIVEESEEYDLVVIGATRPKAITKFFFGSLAESVLHKVQRSMLIVYMPDEGDSA